MKICSSIAPSTSTRLSDIVEIKMYRPIQSVVLLDRNNKEGGGKALWLGEILKTGLLG